MTLRRVHLAMLLVLVSWSSPAVADAPASLGYQGLILDNAGQPLNGTVNLVLRVWLDAISTAPGALAYQENQNAVGVVDGVYQVALGSGTSPLGTFDATLFSTPDRWLEVVVNGETMAPRQKLLSVAYALQSQQCADAAMLGGNTLSKVIQQAQSGLTFGSLGGQISDGQVSATFTRDSEVIGIVAAGGGPGSGINADRLDGIDSSGFTQLGQTIESAEITDGTIANVDVSPSAAIAGTKVSPDFGTQNVQTTGWFGGTDAVEIWSHGARALRVEPGPVPGLIGGYSGNFASSAAGAVIAGGGQNGAVNSIFANSGAIGGGYGNTVQGRASVVAGGASNTAGGQFAVIPGGSGNQAEADYTLAAGSGALALYAGSFVWADSTGTGAVSTAPNQFIVKAAGGFGLNTNVPQGELQLGSPGDPSAMRFGNSGARHHLISNRDLVLNGFDTDGTLNGSNLFLLRRDTSQFDESVSTDLLLVNDRGDLTITSANAFKPGGGPWSVYSDERLKRNMRPLEHSLDSLLELHGITFEYKNPDAIHELHGERIGMTAQNVEAVFPDWVSQGDDGYKRVTYRGFEALTVEALRELRTEKDAEIAKLERENAELRSREAELAARLARVEAALAQPPRGELHASLWDAP